MTRRSKELGYRWEYELVRWLRGLGWNAKRNGTINGHLDQGDIDGIPWCWQAKNLSQLGPKKLADTMDATQLQAANAGKAWWGIALKRRGKPTREGFFIMPLWQAQELMAIEKLWRDEIQKSR
jgi:hypothetical protein